MTIPKLTSYVTDYSQILQQSELNSLNELWYNYEQQTSNQFVAVLFPNRNGNELFDIGMKLFNENQIGQAWKNNWLLLLISTEEKKIRIVVWYGLEWDLPDVLVSRIIEENIRPLVDNWDFASAVRVFYQRCSEAIENDEASTITNSWISDEQKEDWFWIFWLILGFILASLIKHKKLSKTKKSIFIPIFVWIVVFLLIWLWTLLLVGIIAWLVFGFTWFLPGRGGGRWFGGWSFGGWWFSGWWGFSWGWWAWD